jgi:hypothetical protein
MAKLEGAILGAFGGIIATAVFVGAAVVGCGDDTGGTPTDGGGADQTSGSSSGGSSSSSSSGSSSGSSSSSSGSSSGGASSSSGGDAGDARAPDADAAVALDAEAGVSLEAGPDAEAGVSPGLEAGADAEAGPACTTSTIATADGGSVNVGEGGTGKLFYSFDDGVVPPGWAASTTDPTDAGLTATLSVNTTDGHTCPGALQVTIPFTAGGQVGKMEINLNGPAYRGTTFHAWTKVALPPLADGGANTTVQNDFINGNGQVYAQWRITGSDAGLYSFQDFVNFYPPLFTTWREILVPLTGCSTCSDDGGPVFFDLAQLGADLEIIPQDAAAPVPAVLLLDDIWLE